MQKKPQIIAIVGAPRSGKSFLAEKLSQKYRLKVIYEGESLNIPEEVKEYIRTNTNGLRRILWFRNHQVRMFKQALAEKAKGNSVIIDTFWITYQFYIETLLKGNDIKLATELAQIDLETLPYPDKIIFLKADKEKTIEFLKQGNRDFDKNPNFYEEVIRPVEKAHGEKLKEIKKYRNLEIITVDHSKIDFSNKDDIIGIGRLLGFEKQKKTR